jgi:hypothetical protein
MLGRSDTFRVVAIIMVIAVVVVSLRDPSAAYAASERDPANGLQPSI